MSSSAKREAALLRENAELRARLAEAEETLRAIRAGEVDALVMGEQVYSLKGAETPYRILIEQMYEGAATLLDDGTVLYANRCLGLLLRTPIQELIGSPLRRFVAPADLERFDAALAVGQRGSSKSEFNLRCPDGTTVPVQLSFGLLETQDVRAVCVVVTDLAARKRAEEALQQAHDSLEQRVIERTAEVQREREWLRVTLNSIGDAVIAFDTSARVTFLNPVAAHLTGWPEAEAVGQPAGSVFRIINEQTREPAEDIVARVLREKRAVVLTNHTALRARNGKEIPVEDSAAPILDAAGELAGAVVVFHDVTQRRLAEQALRESHERLKKVLAVETVGVMFWDLNTGCMTDANDTFLKLMGYSRREVEAGELTWQKLTPPEYLEVSRAEIRKFQATGRVGPYEKEYFRKDGTRQWLVFAGSSLGDNACVEFCVDISARKQAEKQLQATNAELAQFNRAMVGRELRMIELKKEVDALCARFSEPLRYGYGPEAK